MPFHLTLAAGGFARANYKTGHIGHGKADPMQIASKRDPWRRPRIAGGMKHHRVVVCETAELVPRAIPVEPDAENVAETAGVTPLSVSLTRRHKQRRVPCSFSRRFPKLIRVSSIGCSEAQVDHVHPLFDTPVQGA